jgi:hypothetical protein
MFRITKNKNKYKNKRMKCKRNNKKTRKHKNKRQNGGTDEYKIIGRGYKVKVLVKIDEPRFVYKVFEPAHDRELSTKQCNIQKHIQSVEQTTIFSLVKIPKLFSCITDDDGRTIIKFQRIYNINDTDINSPTQPINILMRNDDIRDYNDKNDKPVNYITQFLDEDKYRLCIYQLGQMFGVLNFICQIKTDDVEIVFGKLKIDGPPKLFILDFDQCVSYNLEAILRTIESDSKFSRSDFDILGRKHYMTLNKLDEEIRHIFYDGYLTYPIMLNVQTLNIAKNILNNYSK